VGTEYFKMERRMVRKALLIFLAVFLVAVFLDAPVSAADRGAPQITLFGGSSGKVPFPHAQHQERIKDCTVCHSLFPQKTGAMEKMKAEGTLKPKKVMNLQCIRCHRADKRAGKPYGPVTCKTCHIK
jgi:hypothetical protein